MFIVTHLINECLLQKLEDKNIDSLFFPYTNVALAETSSML